VPPGLSKEMIANCKKCHIRTQKPIIYDCCKNTLCAECSQFQNELYNRCYACKGVVDWGKYELYDGLDLKIPPYDRFYYEEHKD